MEHSHLHCRIGAGTLACALGLMILPTQKNRRCNFFRTAKMFFPYVTSLVAVAVVWNMIFNPEMGPVNMLLYTLGLDPPDMPGWAADRHWAMVTVILFGVWKSMGYYMVIYLAGLQGINSELYEAAVNDGANSWRNSSTSPCRSSYRRLFRHRRTDDQSFKVFDQVYASPQGGPGTSTLVLVYASTASLHFLGPRLLQRSCPSSCFFLVLIVTIVQFKRRRD